jgi:hypothetical protein
MKSIALAACAVVVALTAGCGNQPRTPDWQMNAHDGLQRYVTAYMEGNTRVENAEFDGARKALASTGQPSLVARAELTRCAARVASLDFAPCTGFDHLRADVTPGDRAYADYLAGNIAPDQVALLPQQHRGAAAPGASAAALQAIEDPFARLVAAGVMLRTNRADPPVLDAAARTASSQGWRRPLLAWLGAQAQRAQAAGAMEEAQRLRRRMRLVSGEQ